MESAIPAAGAPSQNENVQVAVRIKPSPGTHAWRLLPTGQIQQFDDAGKPVPKQLYSFGASLRRARGGANAPP